MELKKKRPTSTATCSALPSHDIRNVDPSTISDKNTRVSGQGRLSKLENHVVEDRYETSKGPLA